MPDEVLDRLVRSYLQTDQSVYSFGWQGGEPTLMGLPFFERVIELQKRYGKPRSSVANGLQTNATLIDRPLAEHLSRYRFLVGCSLDGPEQIHDQFRTGRNGQVSHSKVVNGIKALRESGASYNVLVLVSQSNVAKAREVYHYLVREGHHYHQYIPCVEFDEAGNLQPYAISGREWGNFLCELFDEWYQKDTRMVSIRHFDSILSRIVDGSDTVCTMGRNCCQYFVVEYNGDVYPCDFFVEPALKLGNVLTHSWSELQSSRQYLDFGNQKSDWNPECSRCDNLDLCNGDCLKHRLYAGNIPQNISYLCDGWKHFYTHTRPRFNTLAEVVVRERQPAGNMNQPGRRSVTSGRIGRNAPCPCGSGLKYKKCCGR